MYGVVMCLNFVVPIIIIDTFFLKVLSFIIILFYHKIRIDEFQWIDFLLFLLGSLIVFLLFYYY